MEHPPHDDSTPPAEADPQQSEEAPAGLEEERSEVDVDRPTIVLPPEAGVRADRRRRVGPSIDRRLWGALVVALYPAVMGLALWLLWPASTAPPTSAPPRATPPLPDLESSTRRIARQADAMLLESRHRDTRLAAIIAREVMDAAEASARAEISSEVAAPPSPTATKAKSATAAATKATRDAAVLAALRDRLDTALSTAPRLRGAIVDVRGRLVHAVGDLPATSRALRAEVTTLLSGDPLPPPLVGAVSPGKPGAYRVAVILPAPTLDAALFEQARRERAQAAMAWTAATATTPTGPPPRTPAKSTDTRRHIALLAGGAGSLLLLGLVIFGFVRPLRRGLALFLSRTSDRATGVEPETAEGCLPQELAAADEMVRAAFAEVAERAERLGAQISADAQLFDLASVCDRAAVGDLSARAEEGSGPAGAVAVAVNRLIDDFQRRALRLRGLSREARAASATAREPETQSEGTAAAELRQRAAALIPMAQLLHDIAARVRGMAERAPQGEELEVELRKLSEAVTTRARTARSYLASLVQSVDEIERGRDDHASTALADRVEAELASLNLDASFPDHVGALRDLPAEEIRRRLERDALLASPATPEGE